MILTYDESPDIAFIFIHQFSTNIYTNDIDVFYFLHISRLLNELGKTFCEIESQLFSTNAFSANTFSLNVLPSFTAIYSQSIVNTSNFITYFFQRKQISRK